MIKEIHESDVYGFIIESGCAATLANTLMSEPNSSNTIHFAKQPYSKEYEESQYEKKWERSVSKKYTSQVLIEELSIKYPVNFGLVTSWQMEQNSIHGWYSIFYKEKFTHLHVTIPVKQVTNRKHILSLIAEIGTRIIYYISKNDLVNIFKDFKEGNISIDLIEDSNKKLIQILENAGSDYPLVFENNKPIRFEELMRRKESFIIQKGSFNPIHHGHTDLMDVSLNKYPNSLPVFLISIDRYDKPHIEMDELLSKIERINSLGYIVIIMKSIYFYDTFDILSVMTNKKLYFPIGSDTMNRIYEADSSNKNIPLHFRDKYILHILDKYFSQFKFILYDRPDYPIDLKILDLYQDIIDHNKNYEGTNISSTRIREGKLKNKLDEKN